MEAVNFILQICDFKTNTDEWEELETFDCAFNSGYFKDTSSGNCKAWESDVWHTGKVRRNQEGSFDLVRSYNTYRLLNDALSQIK